MESKTNYRIVGIAVLALLAGFIIAGLWLSIGFDKTKYNYYIVYMDEPVSGLNEESLVKYNGVKIGQVTNIQLSKFDPQQVRVLLSIAEGTPITTATRATLVTQGITGNTFMGLTATSSSLIPLQKTPGEPYPVIPSEPSFINQLEKNIDDVSQGIKRVFDEENAQNFKKTLASLQKVTEAIAKNNESINKTLQELPLILSDLRIGIKRFNVMSENMSTASISVNGTMKAAKKGLNQISQQAIPPTILLLRRLDVIAGNLEKVSAQMRQNPAVIIRGNTPPKLGPGE